MALISQLSLDELKTHDDDWPTDSSVHQELAEESYALCYDPYRPGSDLAKAALENLDDSAAMRRISVASENAMPTSQSLLHSETDWTATLEAAMLSLPSENKAQDAVSELLADSPQPNPAATIHKLALCREKHVEYLRTCLFSAGDSCKLDDANRPWRCFNAVRSLQLLGVELSADESNPVVEFLLRCRTLEGVFAGGPGQAAHLASTYAAVLALVCLGSAAALAAIDRAGVRRFLVGLVRDNGAVASSAGGEASVRSAYHAAALGSILRLDLLPEFRAVPGWIAECQSYEGGFGRVPFAEASAQHTFCAFSALCLLKRIHLADLEPMVFFASRRQLRLEGGFQSRTAGVVDLDSAFWLASLFPLIRRALIRASEDASADESDEEEEDADRVTELGHDSSEPLLCCPASLQTCLLAYAQSPSGGFVGYSADSCSGAEGKDAGPSTAAPAAPAAADPAVTSFALCSLSIAQHYAGTAPRLCAARPSSSADATQQAASDQQPESATTEAPSVVDGNASSNQPTPFIVGNQGNLLECVDPLLGISSVQAAKAAEHFSSSI